MTSEQRKFAEYLHERARELSEVALLNGFPVAAQCFDMARLEVELALKANPAVNGLTNGSP